MEKAKYVIDPKAAHLPEGQTMVLCILLLVGKSRMHKKRLLVPGAGETREAEV